MFENRLRSTSLAVLLIAVTVVLGLSNSAGALPTTDFVVSNLNDSGPGSLRQAMIDAGTQAGKDKITFSVSGMITLQSTLPVVDDDLLIDGSGQDVTISGDKKYRVLELLAFDSIPVLELKELTIKNGQSIEGVGGILNDGGELMVANCWFENNRANSGSQDDTGGAINNKNGALHVTDSQFVNNSAIEGGAIYSNSTTVVDNSTFFDNDAHFGGAMRNEGGNLTVSNSEFIENTATVLDISAGGAISNAAGALLISDSNFTENEADWYGGAIGIYKGSVTVNSSAFETNSADFGGAIYLDEDSLTVNDSTFYKNEAEADGGAIEIIFGTAGITNSTFYMNNSPYSILFNFQGETTVTNSTFFNNAAASKGVVDGGSSTTLRNTILDDQDNQNCFGTIIDGGNNIESGTTCGWASDKGSLSSTDSKLDILYDNGGPTETVALLPGSPALDKVTHNVPNGCPAADQRGVTRPVGSACDAGAFESTAQPGPNFVVNILWDTDDGSCDLFVQDISDCTLREAMKAARSQAGKNTITFDSELKNGTITLNETLPYVDDELTVDGQDRAITVSGDGKYRVMELLAFDGSPVPVFELKQLAISGGYHDVGAGIFNDGGELVVNNGRFDNNEATGAGENDGGGAIFSKNGALDISNSLFTDNQSASYGGAVFSKDNTAALLGSTFTNNSAWQGGAVYTGGGNLDNKNCEFKDNESISNGGAIYSHSGRVTVNNSTFYSNNTGVVDEGGALFINSGSATIDDTAFESNSAYKGGAVFFKAGSLTAKNSTFENNSTTDTGAAIKNASGAVTITNVTFYENNSPVSVVDNASGQTMVTNSTFAANDAASYGVANDGGLLTLRNTILADQDNQNCSGSITNGGNNIDSGVTCGWGSGKGSLSSSNPKLDSLADNGGPTKTAALLPGSPAIDAITYDPPNGCPDTDQRGAARPFGSACDSGAYEFGASPPPEDDGKIFLPVVLDN